MRVAPPVDHPLAREGLWARLVALLAAVAAAVPIAWLAWQLHAARASSLAADLSLAILAMAAALAAARQAARRAGAPGHLRWDGAAWFRLDGAGRAEALGTPSMRIDLGGALLLRAPRPGQRACWIAVERRDAPGSWHGLRVALSQPPHARDPLAPTAGSVP